MAERTPEQGISVYIPTNAFWLDTYWPRNTILPFAEEKNDRVTNYSAICIHSLLCRFH